MKRVFVFSTTPGSEEKATKGHLEHHIERRKKENITDQHIATY